MHCIVKAIWDILKHNMYVSDSIHLLLQSYLSSSTVGAKCPDSGRNDVCWMTINACIKSTRYLRRTDHCTISTLARGHHTTKRLSWLPANLSQWWVLVQCWIWWSLLTVWTLLWYYETRLLGGRPETSLCFYLLVWPQIKHLQRHQTCVEAKETRTKGSDVFTSVHTTAADITSHRDNEDAVNSVIRLVT